MIFRKLGKSNLSISAIVFGAWAIGGWSWGGTNRREALKAIEKSIDLGATSIDTAPVYGFGLSEELIAEAIKGKRDKVQILTKCGIRWDIKSENFYFDTIDNDGKPVSLYKNSKKESIIEECNRSLKRLRTDYIDLYQIHWYDITTPLEESMEAFEILKKEGKILEGGVCNFALEELKKALNYFNLVSNQIPYNMIRREYEKEVIPYCKENNLAILAYSPLQRGLLTGKISVNHKFQEGDSRATNPYFKRENIEAVNNFLNRIKYIAEERNITLGQLVINWTVFRDGITAALVGARDAKQVEENIKALEFRLTDEEINFINEQLNSISLNL